MSRTNDTVKSGDVFGQLTVLDKRNGNWRCRCRCGLIVTRTGPQLLRSVPYTACSACSLKLCKRHLPWSKKL